VSGLILPSYRPHWRPDWSRLLMGHLKLTSGHLTRTASGHLAKCGEEECPAIENSCKYFVPIDNWFLSIPDVQVTISGILQVATVDCYDCANINGIYQVSCDTAATQVFIDNLCDTDGGNTRYNRQFSIFWGNDTSTFPYKIHLITKVISGVRKPNLLGVPRAVIQWIKDITFGVDVRCEFPTLEEESIDESYTFDSTINTSGQTSDNSSLHLKYPNQTTFIAPDEDWCDLTGVAMSYVIL